MTNSQNDIIFMPHRQPVLERQHILNKTKKIEAKNQIRYLMLYLWGNVTHHQLGFKLNKCKLGLEREVDRWSELGRLREKQ